MKNEFSIAPGAVFRVVWKMSSTEHGEFEGTYKGLSAIASDTALVFDVGGTLRFLSSSSVLCMDQLSAAPECDGKKNQDPGSVFYG